MKRAFLRLGLALVALASFVFSGCANERPLRPVIANKLRIPKRHFDGTYLYLKSVTDVKYPGRKYQDLVPGYYLDSDKLVKFAIREKTLDIIAIDPLYQDDRPVERNAVIASFPVRHVDVLRKQNADGQDTNEEEETETRRPWEQREFVVVDPVEDAADEFVRDTRGSGGASTIAIDSEKGAMNFDVARRMSDDTLLKVRYSLMKHQPSATYDQREYPRALQSRFGFFKTVTYRFDRYGRMTTRERREYMNRWDTSKPIQYYYSKDFPEHLKPVVRRVFASWNRALKVATNTDLLPPPLDNTGQELGDIRFNLVVYDNSPDAKHDILGYGPGVTNPRTGQIVKGDVFLYGNTLRRAVYNERLWEDSLEARPRPIAPAGDARDDASGPGLPGGNAPAPAVATFLPSSADINAMRGAQAQLLQQMTKLLEEDPRTRQKTFVAGLKRQHLSDHSRRITRMSGGIISAPNRNKNGYVSDEELEIQIFGPLLAHELGHNINLRHNFKASADKAHFRGTSKASSVMDYAFLSLHEPADLGPYDEAAVKVAYGRDAGALQDLVNENYFYCTDEQALDSRDGLCNAYDAGTTLQEAVENHLRRYYASYIFNNVRQDLVHFDEEIGPYLSRVALLLLPIRQIYDHAAAIVRARDSDAALWSLLRQRIEADKTTPANLQQPVRVVEDVRARVGTGSPSYEPVYADKVLDKKKKSDAIQDAILAKTKAFQALEHLVVFREPAGNRPDYPVESSVDGDLLRLGVLPDRILGIILLGMRNPDPTAKEQVMTPFSTLDEGLDERFRGMVADFFASLISNTVPDQAAAGGRFAIRGVSLVDFNLRAMALEILIKELAVYGESADARQLLAVERVTIDANAVERKRELRKTIRELGPLLPRTQNERVARVAQSVASHLAANPLSPLTSVGILATTPTDMNLDEIKRQYDAAVEELRRLEAGMSPGALREEAQYELIENYRAQMKELLKEQRRGPLNAFKDADLKARIATLEEERARVNVAYARLYGENQFLKAPLTFPGKPLRTATGYLIRDSINRAETLVAALQDLKAEAEADKRAEEEKDPLFREAITIERLNNRIRELGDEIRAYERFLSAERDFAERIFRWFQYDVRAGAGQP